MPPALRWRVVVGPEEGSPRGREHRATLSRFRGASGSSSPENRSAGEALAAVRMALRRTRTSSAAVPDSPSAPCGRVSAPYATRSFATAMWPDLAAYHSAALRALRLGAGVWSSSNCATPRCPWCAAVISGVHLRERGARQIHLSKNLAPLPGDGEVHDVLLCDLTHRYGRLTHRD